jgi:hypothetical protein
MLNDQCSMFKLDSNSFLYFASYGDYFFRYDNSLDQVLPNSLGSGGLP